jgi:ABC-type transporter Mla maintaining outer membrane lipid asymmetry ATPase subunit MlaF
VTSEPLVEMAGVVKNYSGLRPLRIASLSIAAAERVAIGGIDAAGAEVLLNLVTGASLPDDGEVRVFGRRTADVANGDEWLASLDSFGIVSDRAVLLEGATLAQNLALPFTLEIDPLTAETRRRVQAIAEECDIAAAWLEQRAGEVPAEVRVRAHLARAIALGPRLLLMEHPTAALAQSGPAAFGTVVARVCQARALAMLAITLDSVFASIAAQKTLTLQPVTGQLTAARRSWWRRT